MAGRLQGFGCLPELCPIPPIPGDQIFMGLSSYSLKTSKYSWYG